MMQRRTHWLRIPSTVLLTLSMVALATANEGTPPALNGMASTEPSKRTASDATAGDQYGKSVAVSGEIAVVGATGNDDAGTDAGAIYLLRLASGNTHEWTEFMKLLAGDAAAGDSFGASVAISQSTIIVGADNGDGAVPDSGAVYVFGRDAGGTDEWGQVRKLFSADGATGDRFGRAVAVHGDIAVVGAFADDDGGTNSGSVYVFQRDTGGPDNWGQVAKLTSANGGEPYGFFGLAVATNGDTIVVGAPSEGYDDTGTVYVYGRDAGGVDQWGHAATLYATVVTGDDEFGRSVSVSDSGETIAVGAPYWSGKIVLPDGFYYNIRDEGAVFVYERDSNGSNDWRAVAKLHAADGHIDFELGWNAVIDGELLVATTGTRNGQALYVFRKNSGGARQWAQVGKIPSPDPDFFPMAFSGDTVLIADQWDDEAELDAGAVYFLRTFPCESCGNGVLDPGEQCDDEGMDSGDGCSATCIAEPCADNDGDGFGEPGSAACSNGPSVDCDDADPAIHPGAVERCNGIDDDCDSMSDETFVDFEIRSPATGVFGLSVAISGDTAVIGDSATRAYIHERNAGGAGNWGQVAALPLGGEITAISGDHAIVGANLFARDAGGLDNWGYVAGLAAGRSVAISGDTAVVGSSGFATVYERHAGGTNNWGSVAVLMGPVGGGDLFGEAVSISGDRIVVTDRGRDAALVFERNSGGPQNWGQIAELTDADLLALDFFGWDVAISGSTVAVQGSFLWVFERNAGGADNWGNVAKTLPSDVIRILDCASPNCRSLSVDGDRIVLGEYRDDETLPGAGAAYVFERNAGGPDHWGEILKLTANDGEIGDLLGSEVSIDGDTVLVGRSYNDGPVHVFDLASFPPCGDGVVGCDEACDDGDLLPGDGCSPTCVGDPCIDEDEDGFGVFGSPACPGGNLADCNDGDPTVNPGATESCNGADDDCDGAIDNDAAGFDLDADGISNACDNCPRGFNPTQQDSDGDGRADACDNCAEVANSDQADADCDGRGDACDPCLNQSADDLDGDGVCGGEDNCENAYNPDQQDSDGDSIGDACDNCPTSSNSDQANGDLQSQYRWADLATASSEWSATDRSAAQATGPAELNACNTAATNWSPLDGGPDPEWLELTYVLPLRPVGIDIYESGLESSFVQRIEVRDTGGQLHTVWQDVDTRPCGGTLTPRWPAPAYDVTGVVVHTQTEGWEEIDAVSVVHVDEPASDSPGNACDVCPFVQDLDQSDGDGDGAGDACDCAPNDPSARPAAEVLGVVADQPTPGLARFSWPATSWADAYTLARGSLSELRAGSFGDCVVPTQTATSHDDGETPAPGEGFAYLIRGINSVCGMGTLGAGVGGFERVNADPDACW